MGNGFWSPLQKKKKAAVGKINGLTQVTPATIAYAVTQARFALSSCEEWGVEDGQFILQDFYHAILELFEDEEDKWVVETLAWWNRYVSSLPFNLHDNILCRQFFPDQPGSKNKQVENDNAEPDPNSIRSKATRAVTEGRETTTTTGHRRIRTHRNATHPSIRCFISCSYLCLVITLSALPSSIACITHSPTLWNFLVLCSLD